MGHDFDILGMYGGRKVFHMTYNDLGGKINGRYLHGKNTDVIAREAMDELIIIKSKVKRPGVLALHPYNTNFHLWFVEWGQNPNMEYGLDADKNPLPAQKLLYSYGRLLVRVIQTCRRHPNGIFQSDAFL
jgi:hypothetical protein